MIHRKMLVRLCGAGLLALLGPVSVEAQTATGGTGATTGASPTTTSAGASGINGGGGTSTTGAAPALTTATTICSATSGTAGSTTTIPSSTNVFANTMVNPYSLGLPMNYANQFGAQNVISTAGGPKGSFTYMYTAPATTATGGSATTTTATGFSTYGIPRSPVYSTVLAQDMPLPLIAAPQLQTQLRAMIQRSRTLKNKAGIQVSVQGNVVVLSGTVPTITERGIVEGMVRMTPGVFDVRNDLNVPAPKQ